MGRGRTTGPSVVLRRGEMPIQRGHPSPHRLHPGGLRYGARRPRKVAGIAFHTEDCTGAGHEFHVYPPRHRADGYGGASPRTALGAQGVKAYRHGAKLQAAHKYRKPVFPGSQGNPRQLKHRRV